MEHSKVDIREINGIKEALFVETELRLCAVLFFLRLHLILPVLVACHVKIPHDNDSDENIFRENVPSRIRITVCTR